MIVKVAVFDPAATVTLVGTVAEVELQERGTLSPVAGAELLSVMAPIDEEPPVTGFGATMNEESVGGLTVRFAVALDPDSDAVIVAKVLTDTGLV